MKICPNCKADLPSELESTCMYCGHDVRQVEDASQEQKSSTSAETNDSYYTPEHSSISLDDDISLETTSDLMEKKALETPGSDTAVSNENLIGSSSPPPPPAPITKEMLITHNSPEEFHGTGNKDQLKVLSEDEIKTIEKELYASSPNSFMTNKDKKELLNKFENSKIDNVTGSTKGKAPISDIQPQSDMPKPQIAKKSKGMAYFYKNFIQLKGSYNILTGDEMIINSREYLLKPKKINPKIFISSVAATLAIIIIITGFYFLGGSPAGYGHIAGIVLNENDQPYIQGATIKLTDAGKTVQANAQGFFQFSEIPVGPQKIEYIIKSEVIKVDYITVSTSDISFILLKPEEDQEEYAQAAPLRKNKPIVVSKTESKPSPPPAPPVQQAKKSNIKKSVKPKSSSTQYANITLNTDVDGAKFVVDGKVLGAGNLTYSKIKPGSHNYIVSADGYKESKGTFSVKSGGSKTLTLQLTSLQTVEKIESFQTTDYLYSGKAALKSGNFKTAIEDLNEVIKEQPGMADAYYYRGQAFTELNKSKEAHDDFIKAAEIFQFGKNYNKAISSYNFAIEADKNSKTAYLGRAKLYLSKSEPLAAIPDFDKVLKLDKRNFDAYYGLGEASFKQQRYKTAINHFKDARSIDKNNPLVHQYLMLSYMAVDDYNNVKKSFEKFKNISSDEEMQKFINNRKYSAVLKIIDLQ